MTIRERIAAAEAKPSVTAAELSLLSGFSVDTIRRAGEAGDLPTLRLGRGVRYLREDCLRIMRGRGETAGDRRRRQEQRETLDA